MTVYVDDMKAGFGRMVMCHMLADTDEELHAMADKIGVRRKWFQKPGTPSRHYDICRSKRALAVSLGAVEITWKMAGMMTIHRRKNGVLPTLEEAKRQLAEHQAKIQTTISALVSACIDKHQDEERRSEMGNTEYGFGVNKKGEVIKPGQLWENLDKRCNGQVKQVLGIDLKEGKATMQTIDLRTGQLTGPKSRLSFKRMHVSHNGWKLREPLPKAGD